MSAFLTGEFYLIWMRGANFGRAIEVPS